VLSAVSAAGPMLGKRSGIGPACTGMRPPDRRDEPDTSAKGGIVLHVLHREEGQGLAEYGLIGSIIAIFAVLSLMFISGNLTKLLSLVGHNL